MFVLPALVLCVLLLTGCGGAGAPPTGASSAVILVVTAVWKRRKLDDDPLLHESTGNIVTDFGKHVKFFIRLRAEAHLEKESDTDKVATAVSAEYDTVRVYVATKIGLDSGNPNALVKGTDKSPPHLDLDDVLRPMTSSPNPVEPGTKLTEELNRWQRANNIIWRAAAIERRVWVPAPGSLEPPGFSSAAMDELLDRRLRIVERLWYQINETVTRGALVPDSSKPHGAWLDGARVRMFEYPEFDASEELRQEIGPQNIGPGKVWREEPGAGTFVYGESAVRWNTRIRKDAAPSFSAPPPASWGNDYGYAMEPASGAKAIDDLFTHSEDWWDRSWIFCDEVLAALHLESLRFGKLRRLQDNDASFNSVLASHSKGWAGLRPVIGPPGSDPRLIADDDAKQPPAPAPPTEPLLFSNGPVTHLQLGDHVVFWNSIMYGLLSNGAWSLENAVVVSLTSDWESNDYADKLSVMGHGTRDKTDGEFRLKLAKDLNKMIARARNTAIAAAPGVDFIPWLRQSAPLVRWAPYGEPWVDQSGQPRSPWWIRVPYEATPDWVDRALGRKATLDTLPDAVEPYAPPFPPGYKPPPGSEPGPPKACYFPLWVPPQEDRWKGYLERRRAGTVDTTFQLEKTTFAGKNIPGLVAPREFVPGQQSQHVFAARPYVTR